MPIQLQYSEGLDCQAMHLRVAGMAVSSAGQTKASHPSSVQGPDGWWWRKSGATPSPCRRLGYTWGVARHGQQVKCVQGKGMH